MWTICWDNDTGSDDGYYWEWWDIIDPLGNARFTAQTEADAKFLADLLNNYGQKVR